MKPWLIVILVIGLIVLAGIINVTYWWRRYTKVVGSRLSSYASLVKTCPVQQTPLVFQEITELMESMAMTKIQLSQAQQLLCYLMGRMDQAGIKDVVIV